MPAPTERSSSHLSVGTPSSFAKFLTSLSPKSSSSSLKKRKEKEKEKEKEKVKTATTSSTSGTGDGGLSSGSNFGKGKQAKDKNVAALGRALARLAETVFVTDLERDYYARFSDRMEMLCGPWDA